MSKPQQKNVTHKHFKPNQYEAHATHYLLEPQVSFNLGIKMNSTFCKLQLRFDNGSHVSQP
jgi:hypothetical protein